MPRNDRRVGRRSAVFLAFALGHAAAGGAVGSEMLALRLDRNDEGARRIFDVFAPSDPVADSDPANRLMKAIRTNAPGRMLLDDEPTARKSVAPASDIGPGTVVASNRTGKRTGLARIEPNLTLTEEVFAREQPPERPVQMPVQTSSAQTSSAQTSPAQTSSAQTSGPGAQIDASSSGRGWRDRVDVVETAASGAEKATAVAKTQGLVDEYEDYFDESPDGDGVSISAYLEGEVRGFVQKSEPPGLSRWSTSIAFSPEIEASFGGGDQQLSIQPFVRLDSEDGKRTHFDLREAKWVGLFGPVEARIGVDVVFWGVTESIHLADVINQDDLLEDIDNEDKLGQPMASLAWDTGHGVITGFVLPYFRERRFPGVDGRPSTPLLIDRSQALFESGEDDWHVDDAVRYSHASGPFDFGVYYFAGTARDPQLIPQTNLTGDPVLIPRYEVVDQVGFDGQATFGALLLKLEAIHQWDNSTGHFTAAAGGFEYTLFNIAEDGGDLGILFEYLHDGRGETLESPFEDDVFAALRYASSDAGTQLLAGGIIDTGDGATAINIEASQRLSDSWRVSLDARLFLDVPATNALAPFRDDDFLQLRLTKFF